MNGFAAFTKKEFLEQIRSFRAVILIAVLFLFGMTSPLLAKIMPDIFTGMNIQGMTIQIPAPTILDAYGQFFKNIGQMGLVVLLLIFSGFLSQDVTKGTLTVLLAKGLSRHAVIASKFISALVIWTVGFTLAAMTAWGYTFFLFGDGNAPCLMLAFLSIWLLGAFILALLIISSTAAPGSYGGLLLSAVVLIVLLVLNSFPALQKWNPVTLAARSAGLLSNQVQPGDMSAVIWVTLGLIAVFLVLAAALFRKKRL